MQTYCWQRASGDVELYRIREYSWPDGAPGLVVDTPGPCPVLEIDPAAFHYEHWQLTAEAVDAAGNSGSASELSAPYTPVPEPGVFVGLVAGVLVLRLAKSIHGAISARAI